MTSSRRLLRDRFFSAFMHKLQGEIIYAPPPPSPHFWLKGIFQGRGVGVYILRPHAPGILYAPPFYTPPTPRRVFSGVGGWGCIKFGPVQARWGDAQRLLEGPVFDVEADGPGVVEAVAMHSKGQKGLKRLRMTTPVVALAFSVSGVRWWEHWRRARAQL